MQDVEIKVCTHRFECDALKVAATQTYWTYRINYINFKHCQVFFCHRIIIIRYVLIRPFATLIKTSPNKTRKIKGASGRDQY